MVVIPLITDTPSQSFKLSVDRVKYTFKVFYNTRAELWQMDISSDSVEIATGVFLTAGVTHLNQYNIALKNLIAVNLMDSTIEVAYDGLGTDSKILFMTQAELEAYA